MMAVSIQSDGRTLEAGDHLSLFPTTILGGGNPAVHPKPQYAVTRDGQRFLINTIVDEPTAQPITIVTHRTRTLEK